MKISKIFLLLVVMAMLFSVACDSDPKTEVKSDKVAVDKEKEEEAEEAEEAIDGANMDEEQPEAPGGVNLPEGYPIDLVPIMDDATSGSGINTDGAFNITYSTPSTGEQVMEFYRQHFQRYGDAVIIADNNLEINLRAESRDIQILIDPSGQTTNLRIFIGGVSEENENLNGNNDNNDQANISNVSEEFPTDIIPIMDGGEVYDMSSQSVNFTTKKPFKEVIEFYKEIVNTMENANISDGDYEFFATASKGENSVEIQIMDTGDNQTVVLINIYLE